MIDINCIQFYSACFHLDALGLRSPTSFNMLPGISNPGNTSPGQGRSLREYDEKLHVLQKENFHLKLRLFFLEEKLPPNGSSKSEDEHLFKQNVDLKVGGLLANKTIVDSSAQVLDLIVNVCFYLYLPGGK